MTVRHAFSNTTPDFTGTITGFNSQGSTVTLAASNLVRPSDWNSVHNIIMTLTGNTSGDSTVSGSNIVLSGGDNVTLRGNGSVIEIIGPAEVTRMGYNPFGYGAESVAGQQGTGTLYIAPMTNTPNFNFDRIIMPIQLSNASNSSFSATFSFSFAIFTRNESNLSLLTSVSTSHNFSASGTVGSYSLWGGIRNLTIPLSTTLTRGDYWVGIWSRTTTGGGAGMTINQMLVSQPNSSHSGVYGEATNATNQGILGQGRYSVSFSTAMPNSVPFSQIQGNSSALLRPPIFRFEQGTV